MFGVRMRVEVRVRVTAEVRDEVRVTLRASVGSRLQLGEGFRSGLRIRV